MPKKFVPSPLGCGHLRQTSAIGSDRIYPGTADFVQVSLLLPLHDQQTVIHVYYVLRAFFFYLNLAREKHRSSLGRGKGTLGRWLGVVYYGELPAAEAVRSCHHFPINPGPFVAIAIGGSIIVVSFPTTRIRFSDLQDKIDTGILASWLT